MLGLADGASRFDFMQQQLRKPIRRPRVDDDQAADEMPLKPGRSNLLSGAGRPPATAAKSAAQGSPPSGDDDLASAIDGYGTDNVPGGWGGD
jgi:hypothetical protein